VASACSSGGIALKLPGRVGQAGMFGCGCWAHNDSTNGRSVSTSTSGCGEYLIRTMLARTAAEGMLSKELPSVALYHTIVNDFLGKFWRDRFYLKEYIGEYFNDDSRFTRQNRRTLGTQRISMQGS